MLRCFQFDRYIPFVVVTALLTMSILAVSRDALFNQLTPNGHYMGRTAHLTSRCCILNIYSTNIRTEYFKHAA